MRDLTCILYPSDRNNDIAEYMRSAIQTLYTCYTSCTCTFQHLTNWFAQQNPDGSPKVNVMCGVTVEELMDFELKHGVNLPCNVILTTPTYGGIIAAGCHVRVLVTEA